MNDDSRAVAGSFDFTLENRASKEARLTAVAATPPPVPGYLQETYWWAYLHPKSFWFFEREWVVNLILWGNMKRLTESVLTELAVEPNSRVLQVACVYGDFSNRVSRHLGRSGSRLEIIDVADVQLANLRRKLDGCTNVGIHHQDSTQLTFPQAAFDQTVVFFLLHEQPEEARRKTVAEALRVTRPGGKVIFVDYHGPQRRNPFRYVMKPILKWLEPFAMDLWREELTAYLPADFKPEKVESEFYFGGLYQKVVVTV